jgi:Ca2+-binding EF-hand superfamily protein
MSQKTRRPKKTDGTFGVARFNCEDGGTGPSTTRRNGMKKIMTLGALMAAATTFGTVSAFAQMSGQHGHQNQMSFETLDTDGNGEITRDEMMQRRTARMMEADADADGKLTVAELEEAMRKRAEARVAEMMKTYDADGDGVLVVEELSQSPRSGRMFERIDLDKSGGVSREEFEQAQARMKDRMDHHGKMRSNDN